MNFKPGLVEKILTGKKTMTRLPVKWPGEVREVRTIDGHQVPTTAPAGHGETACAFQLGATRTRQMPGCRYQVGRDYALQRGSGGPGVGPRLRIEAVRLECLGEITPHDAIAEGFKTTDRFYDHWERIHKRVDRQQWVWVLTFELVTEERVRYLGRRGGYTEEPELAMHEEGLDEPQNRAWAVDATWQRDHSDRRRAAFDDERERELDERLAAALEEARRSGYDINRHRAAIARRVDALERDLRKAKTRARAA